MQQPDNSKYEHVYGRIMPGWPPAFLIYNMDGHMIDRTYDEAEFYRLLSEHEAREAAQRKAA